MKDWWVDGHFLSADSADAARIECEALYGHSPDVVRPWGDTPKHDYEVSVSLIVEATSHEDAVRQMVAWLDDDAYHAGYRTENLTTGESEFIDADEMEDGE